MLSASSPWSMSFLKVWDSASLFTAVDPSPGPGLFLKSGAPQTQLAGGRFVSICGSPAVFLEAMFSGTAHPIRETQSVSQHLPA